MNEQPVHFRKTRIAPTPSGFLHLGNALSFAITAALAKKCNASVLLRIDDLDRERANKIYVQDIFDTLHFLQVPWQEGPKNMQEYENEYSQMYRLDLYQLTLTQLAAENKVFACTCTRAQVQNNNGDNAYPGTCRDKKIPLDTPNVNWRLRTDHSTVLSVKTWPGPVIETTLPLSMQDFVVRKKDGFPAYQLASVTDDIHYGVDLIIRGEDLWDSTLAQHYLAIQTGATAFLNSCFYHHPLLTGTGGIKLSKSAGSTSIQYLRKQGKKPEEIYRMIAGMPGMENDVSNWQEILDFRSVAFLYY